MFTPTLRCECAQPASDRLMRKWCITCLEKKKQTREPGSQEILTFGGKFLPLKWREIYQFWRKILIEFLGKRAFFPAVNNNNKNNTLLYSAVHKEVTVRFTIKT